MEQAPGYSALLSVAVTARSYPLQDALKRYRSSVQLHKRHDHHMHVSAPSCTSTHAFMRLQGALDYRGYIVPRNRGERVDNNERLLSCQFAWNGEVKPVTTLFIGGQHCIGRTARVHVGGTIDPRGGLVNLRLSTVHAHWS
jgi:hypothetical protein